MRVCLERFRPLTEEHSCPQVYRREGEAEVGPEDLARKGKNKYKGMALSLQDSISLGKVFGSGEGQENPRRNERFQITVGGSLVRCRTDKG